MRETTKLGPAKKSKYVLDMPEKIIPYRISNFFVTLIPVSSELLP